MWIVNLWCLLLFKLNYTIHNGIGLRVGAIKYGNKWNQEGIAEDILQSEDLRDSEHI